MIRRTIDKAYDDQILERVIINPAFISMLKLRYVERDIARARYGEVRVEVVPREDFRQNRQNQPQFATRRTRSRAHSRAQPPRYGRSARRSRSTYGSDGFLLSAKTRTRVGPYPCTPTDGRASRESS